MSDLPAPPIPADADLRGFAFTPIYRARLFGSTFHAKATDAEWRAGVTLWLKAQDQVPAGSLPDDDVELCRLAELGRDLRAWRRLRPMALHGWTLHSDGRLYNPVVTEVAMSQWTRLRDERDRREKWREKKRGQRQDVPQDVPGDISGTKQNVPGDVPRENPLKGQGQGQGQGQGYSESALLIESPVGGEGGGGGESSRAAGAPPRGTRLPADWTLTPELRQRAAAARAKFKLPAVDLDLEAAKFAAYWLAKSGAQATKLDWGATWQNWALKAELPRGPNGHAQASEIQQNPADSVFRSLDRQFGNQWPARSRFAKAWQARDGAAVQAALAEAQVRPLPHETAIIKGLTP